MEETYNGGCHCGRVQFRVTTDLAEVLGCNCSICRKKGFLHVIVAPEKFQLLIGADALASYSFNTGVAKHMFCRICGIHSFYRPRSHRDKIDVNARCLEGVGLSALMATPFNGQHWETPREQLR